MEADPYSPALYVSPTAYATGGLRLVVEPKSAEVVVDNYVAGAVDDFDGHFQHLDLVAGPHHIEMRASGYTSVQFDVNIESNQTIAYRGKPTKS